MEGTGLTVSASRATPELSCPILSLLRNAVMVHACSHSCTVLKDVVEELVEGYSTFHKFLVPQKKLSDCRRCSLYDQFLIRFVQYPLFQLKVFEDTSGLGTKVECFFYRDSAVSPVIR